MTIWVCTSFLCFCPVSQAVILYDFDIFTIEGDYHDDPGLSMHVKVSETADDSHVLFEFFNTSTIASSAIGRIYFEGDSFAGIYNIESSPGVQFHQGAKPHHLPSGSLLDPYFEANRAYSLTADKPMPHNGVNSGEEIAVVFELQQGLTYDNIIGRLNNASLRIGLHVIGLPDGSSESALNSIEATYMPPIPEPATIALLGLGSLVLFCKNRSQKEHQNY